MRSITEQRDKYVTHNDLVYLDWTGQTPYLEKIFSGAKLIFMDPLIRKHNGTCDIYVQLDPFHGMYLTKDEIVGHSVSFDYAWVPTTMNKALANIHYLHTHDFRIKFA